MFRIREIVVSVAPIHSGDPLANHAIETLDETLSEQPHRLPGT